MKCPECGQCLHLYILDDMDNQINAYQIICPKHGELLFLAFIDGEWMML